MLANKIIIWSIFVGYISHTNMYYGTYIATLIALRYINGIIIRVAICGIYIATLIALRYTNGIT